MIALLMGCATTSSRPTPSVLQTSRGNAWAIQLPIGTQIKMIDPKQLQAIAVNEMEGEVITKPVILVSPAWVTERDERELELYRTIEKLKIKP